MEVSLPLGTWDGLRFFIVALPVPSVNYFFIRVPILSAGEEAILIGILTSKGYVEDQGVSISAVLE